MYVSVKTTSFFLLLYVALVSADEDDHHEEKSDMSKFVFKRPSYVMPWTKGPNTCAYYRYADATSTQYTSRFYHDCLISDPKPVCGRPLQVEYECCEGFIEGQDSEGCRQVKPLTDLSETMKALGVTALPIVEAGLSRTFTKQGAFTAFVPTNSAIKSAPDFLQSALADRFDSLIKYHMYVGRLGTDDIRQKHVVTMVNGKKAVIFRHCNNMVTINCARIALPNKQSTNGVIHLIDRVIVPFDDATETVMARIGVEPRFSRFRSYLMRDPDLQKKLAEADASYTVFIPTNEALDRLPESVKQRLVEKGVLEDLLKQHIIQNRICATSITGERTYRTLGGADVKLGCGDRLGDLTINGIKVSEIDHVTGNGVIHVIDDVMLPDAAIDAMTLATKLGATEFVALVDKFGLREEFNKMKDVAFFVPGNEAFINLSTEMKALMEDKNYVRLLLKYHILQGKQKVADVIEGAQYKVNIGGKIGKLSIGMLRDNEGQLKYTVQGSEITKADVSGGHFYMNIISRLIHPPAQNLMEFLKSDEEYSQFLSVFLRAGGSGLLRSMRGKFTLIVPNNHAWEHMEEDLVEEMNDRRQVRRILRYHVWPEVLYSNSFKHDFSYYTKTHLGEDMSVKVDHDEMVLNSRVHVSVPDIPMLEGGVVHVVEEILRCRCPFRRRNSYFRRLG